MADQLPLDPDITGPGVCFTITLNGNILTVILGSSVIHPLLFYNSLRLWYNGQS
jgi:hypothetical protein